MIAVSQTVDPRFAQAVAAIYAMNVHDVWSAIVLDGTTLTGWGIAQAVPTTAQITDALAGIDKALFNAPLLAQIATLELKQARPLREQALGDSTAAGRISNIDAQIVALRAQLQQ